MVWAWFGDWFCKDWECFRDVLGLFQNGWVWFQCGLEEFANGLGMIWRMLGKCFGIVCGWFGCDSGLCFCLCVWLVWDGSVMAWARFGIGLVMGPGGLGML